MHHKYLIARSMKKGFIFLTAMLQMCLLQATVYTVNDISDASSGAGNSGTLRYCIEAANGNAAGAPHRIHFAIPGAAPFVIMLDSELPAITRAGTVIDASTQPGFSPGNSPVVYLSISNRGSTGLMVDDVPNVEIYGLQIYNFDYGIYIEGESADGFRIGAPGKRNVINRCENYQILIEKADNGFITGNYIGCDINGSSGFYADDIRTAGGINLLGGANGNKVGGALPGEGNLLAGGIGTAVVIGEYATSDPATGSSGNSFYGNTFGGVGNEMAWYAWAVWIDGNSDNNLIGGIQAGEGNTMAYATNGFSANGYGNLVVGINTAEAEGNQVRGNNMNCAFGNGIVLADGGNNNLPAPVITGTTGNSLQGNAPPNAQVDLYTGSDCNSVYGNFKAETYLITVTAAPSGLWSADLGSFQLPCGSNLVATASTAIDGTSAFSDVFAYCGGGPVAAFTASLNEICESACIDFTSTSTGGPIDNYAWVFEGGEPTVSGDAAPRVCYASAGTYEVSLTVSGGSGSNTLIQTGFITVKAGRAVITGFTFPTPVCPGGEDVNPLPDNNFTSGGRWSANEGLRIDSLTGMISPRNSLPGAYTVTYALPDTGCYAGAGGSGSFSFEIDTLPRLDIKPSGAVNLCKGDTLTLNAASGFELYIWNPGSVSGESITVSEAGSYRVAARAPGGCFAISDTVIVSVTEPPVAAFSWEQTNGYSVAFSNHSSTGSSSTWYFPSADSSLEENPVYEFLYDDTWPVRLVVTNECGSDTLDTNVVVIKTGIESLSDSRAWLFEQNGVLMIHLPAQQAGKVKIGVYNLSGQLLYREEFSSSAEYLVLNGFILPDDGIYLVNISSSQTSTSLKWIFVK